MFRATASFTLNLAACASFALSAPGLAAETSPQPPTIKVTSVPPDHRPNPVLRAAYDALQAADYDGAARLYERVAQSEPRNIDVLLGQAAIAMQRGDLEGARDAYLGALRLEPANVVAQGALLALFGRADYPAAELRLKELAAREPHAFLFQALGTLYAEQGQWPQAQQAYFQAYRLDPRSADHAYNLAVGLDHIGQHDAAQTYYRRALELVRPGAEPGFDPALARARLARLAAPD